MCVPHACTTVAASAANSEPQLCGPGTPSRGPCTCGICGNGLIRCVAAATAATVQAAQANEEPVSADADKGTEAIACEGEVDCTVSGSHDDSGDQQGIIFGNAAAATPASAAASSSLSAQPDDAAKVRPGDLGLDACCRLR